MDRPVIFLDDGGVMNDNEVRMPRVQQLVGEFLAPRLGGDIAAWAEANGVFVRHHLPAQFRLLSDNAIVDYVTWSRGDLRRR